MADDVYNGDIVYNNAEEEKLIFTKTWDRLQEPLQQEGYREGVAAGRETSFQNGFNQGYSDGFKAGFSFGGFNSVIKTLKNDIELDLPLRLDCTKLKPIKNPSRGLCHICTDSGKLLNKKDFESRLDKSYNIPLSELRDKQNLIMENAKKDTDSDFLHLIKHLNFEIE